MSDEINLLPGKTKQTSSLLKKRETLRIIAIGSLFAVSFLSIILFMLIALSPLPSLRQREKDEGKRLSFFNDMIVKILLTNDRLTQIKHIFQTRPVYSQPIDVVRKLIPPNAAIEEIHLDNKIVSITISSTSLSPLDEFIRALVSYNTSSRLFRKITLVSLLQNFDKGKYMLTFKLI
jgi:hypothetical protein